MACEVLFRRADGQGTKTYMQGLGDRQAINAAQVFFDRNENVTMCWVLNERGVMLGDCLTREPPDGDGRSKTLGFDDAEHGMKP